MVGIEVIAKPQKLCEKVAIIHGFKDDYEGYAEPSSRLACRPIRGQDRAENNFLLGDVDYLDCDTMTPMLTVTLESRRRRSAIWLPTVQDMGENMVTYCQTY